MPGPLAAQVAMWVGYLQAGAWGALAVSLPFILPSLAAVLVVSYLYVRFAGLTVIQSLFYGIAPAVVAIIAVAAWRLARLTNRTDARLWGISIVIGAVTALTGTEVALLFLGAGFLMILLDAPPKWLARRMSSDPSTVQAMLVLLERRGFVSRETHPTDGRARTVALTESGQRKFRQAFKAGQTIRDQMVSSLSTAETRTLVKLLRRVSKSLADAPTVVAAESTPNGN